LQLDPLSGQAIAVAKNGSSTVKYSVANVTAGSEIPYTDIVEINENNGTLTLKGEGTVTVSLTITDGKGGITHRATSDEITVVVRASTPVGITYDPGNMPAEEFFALEVTSATVSEPAAGALWTLSWTADPVQSLTVTVPETGNPSGVTYAWYVDGKLLEAGGPIVSSINSTTNPIVLEAKKKFSVGIHSVAAKRMKSGETSYSNTVRFEVKN
jgi:hypothetical protein